MQYPNCNVTDFEDVFEIENECVEEGLKISIFAGIGAIGLLLLILVVLVITVCCLGCKLGQIKKYAICTSLYIHACIIDLYVSCRKTRVAFFANSDLARKFSCILYVC